MAKVETGIVNGLSGRLGNAVFVKTRQGTNVRELPTPNNPRTPAQQATRIRMARCGALYRSLSPKQLQDWHDYAAKTAKRDAQGNPTNATNAYNVFSGLASKYGQMFPDAPPPLDAPKTLFLGDAITLHATSGAGTLTFHADNPNNPNVKTELLLQPLKHSARRPMPRDYRSKGFVTFASGSLDFSVTVEPGVYAPAYRFVHAETGQETALISLPTLVVS